MPVTSKLPNVGTTIFTVMSKLAAEQGAINLSQGFPDFDGPKLLLERVGHHLNGGHNQYAPMAGVVELRIEIARKVAALYGASVDPETEVTVTAGATEAIFCAITAVVRPGDEVLVLDPVYDSYEPAITLAGGIARHVPMSGPAFRPDWDRIRDALNRRTRLFIMNSPHNPTGSVWHESDLRTLAELAAQYDLVVVADEVYEHIVFDGARHESVLRHPDLAARSFVVSSFGKTFHVTGWKIGYCVAPKPLTLELRRIHQYVTFVANTPVQLGLADYMAMAPDYAGTLGAFYQQKRDLFIARLAGSRFVVRPSQGTYFQLLDYSAVSNERDVELAHRLTVEHKVASIPVSVFYEALPEPSATRGGAHEEPSATRGGAHEESRVLRFCFAKNDATLERAAEILCRL